MHAGCMDIDIEKQVASCSRNTRRHCGSIIHMIDGVITEKGTTSKLEIPVTLMLVVKCRNTSRLC